MPSDLTVRPVATMAPATAPEPAATQAEPAGLPAPARALPNPTMRLDEQLGIVVLEFHNGAGAVTSSIPTEKQLDAYRASLRTEGSPPAALAGLLRAPAAPDTGRPAAAPPAAPAEGAHTDLSR